MGLLYAISAAFLVTAKDVVSKSVASRVSGTVSTIASFLYALPFYLLLIAIAVCLGYEDLSFTGKFIGLVAIRAITDIGAEWFKMTALAKGDLSVVAAFYSLSPVFLLFLSPILTGDELTSGGIIGVILVGLGTFTFGMKPSKGQPTQYKAMVLGLISALFFSLNSCFDKLAVTESSPLLSGFAMTALSGLILVPFSKEPLISTLSQNNRPFLLRGFFETIFMICKLAALQCLQAPYVVAIMRGSIIISIISGRTIFKESNFIQRLLGGVIILIGITTIVLTK
jgi:uncharacterized membrane protein